MNEICFVNAHVLILLNFYFFNYLVIKIIDVKIANLVQSKFVNLLKYMLPKSIILT